ncbi:hypothetical protein ACLMJK_008399 [Lecanora helva]
MAQSALLGNPPATPDDKLTAAAIKALGGSEFFPNKAHTYGEPRPSPNPPNPSNGSNIIGLSIFFITIVFFITAGRLVIRTRQKKVNLGLDEVFIVPAAATAIVCDAIVLYVSISECYTHHIYWCTYENFAKTYEALYVNQTIFWVALYFSKISIVFNNRRLTAFTQGWWRIGHWVILAIICVCFLLALFTTVFECSPVKAHYNLIDFGTVLMRDPKSVHCINSSKLTLANRWLHVATDLLLLSVPLIILARLQMPLRKKLSIGFIFCFGIVCVIASIMRNEVWTHPTEDFTCNLIIWDLVDVNFAPIVANLPVYYPVLNWLFRRTKSKLTSPELTEKGIIHEGHRSFESIRDKLLHHNNQRNATPSTSSISGPFIRADDSRLQSIAEGRDENGSSIQKPIPATRVSWKTDSSSSDGSSLPPKRSRMHEELGELELNLTPGDAEEGLRDLPLRF